MAGSSSIPLAFFLILFSVDTHTPELLISLLRQSGKFTTDLD